MHLSGRDTLPSSLSIPNLPYNSTHPDFAIMAPAVTIDNTPDFDMPATTAPAKTASANQRTLLLAPPSVASHPEALTRVAQAYDRNATDIQMLDRLAMGLVALPTATYDVVLLLTDVNGAQQETSRLLDRQVMAKLVHSLKAGGRLRSQDGVFGSGRGAQPTEAILAGLVDGRRRRAAQTGPLVRRADGDAELWEEKGECGGRTAEWVRGVTHREKEEPGHFYRYWNVGASEWQRCCE